MNNEELQKMIEDVVLSKFSTREEYDNALAKVLDGWDIDENLSERKGFANVFRPIHGQMYYGVYLNGYLMYDMKYNRLDLICKDNECIHPDDGFSARVTGARISKPVDDSPKELLLTTHYIIGEPLNEVKE